MRLSKIARTLLMVGIVCFVASGQAAFAEGPNLLDQNTSFEVGLGGWAIEDVRLMDNWGKYGDYGIDTTTAFDGKNSLRVHVKTRRVFRIRCKTVQCEAGQKYTVSYYAKTDRPGIVLHGRFTNATLPMRNLKLTTEWRRCSFTLPMPTDPAKYRKGVVEFWVQTINSDLPIPYTIWLDAFQFEKGELTPISANLTRCPFCRFWP